VAPFHPLRHDARAFTARAGAAFAVFFTIAIVLLAGGADQPLAVAEANKGDTGDGTAAVTAQTDATTVAAPAPEPVLGVPDPEPAPAPVTPAAPPEPAPAPASKAAAPPAAASAPKIPAAAPQPPVGARSQGGGDDDDEGGWDDDDGDRGGSSHDDDDGGWSGGGHGHGHDDDDDDDGGWSGGGKGDDDDDGGWNGGGKGDDDDDDDGGWNGGGDGDDDGRDDDDDDGRPSGGGGGGNSSPSGGGKGGDDDDDDGDDDEPAPSGRGQLVTPPTIASTQTPGSTGEDTSTGGDQGAGTGSNTVLRDQPRSGELAGQDPQRLTTGGNGGAGGGPGSGNGSGGTPAGETTGSDTDPAATGTPAPTGGTAGAEGGAGGEAGAGGGGGGGGGNGNGNGQNDREQASGQEEENGPAAVVERRFRELVNVVPDSIKAALAALAALSVLLGVGYLLAAMRARRLGRQRRELLQEVGLLQTALLPPVPDKVGALLTSVAYRPADGPGAGGDFYDVLPLPGGRVGFILGDVSGHGRGALARTAFMRYTLRAYLEAGLEPRVALQVAGRVIDENLGGDFATVLLAVHDPETGSLTYATAGHPAPIVIGPEPHEPVTAGSSPPIGVGVRTGLRQTTVPLVPGSVAALFTDGLMEARTENGILGRERLQELLEEIGDDATAHRLIERVATEATLLSDDMAAVVVTPTAGVTAGLFRTEQLELSARELDGPIARRFLEATGLPEAEVEEAEREARELADRFGGVVLHVVFGNRLSVEVLPRNVESIEAASRRVSAGSGG
jgi:Stage II sporulation protein E (SpoIIE)